MINEHECIGPIRKKVLLIQPEFPIPCKRKIHHDYFPIGLLKIGTYLKEVNGCEVQLLLENKESNFIPDEIWITSLFTYWSSYVYESINYFKNLYPGVPIYLGGIFATLMADDIHLTGVTIQKGLYLPAERYSYTHPIDETLLEEHVDFQIMHSTRGCFRKCAFCGTWKIETEETYNSNVPNMINKNHVIFYDNNILKRPDIEDFLSRLSKVRVNGKRVIYESQSGFDGRICDQDIAKRLHDANFVNVRIAWDGSLDEFPSISDQINALCFAGYARKDLFVFMLYNWNLPPEELEKKRQKCWELGVQIADCRFRPLNQLYDNYSTRILQNSNDYYIHPNWSDDTIKDFRRNVRRHNICVRHGLVFYSKDCERKKVSKEESMKMRNLKDKNSIKAEYPDSWFPDEYHMR